MGGVTTTGGATTESSTLVPFLNDMLPVQEASIIIKVTRTSDFMSDLIVHSFLMIFFSMKRMAIIHQ